MAYHHPHCPLPSAREPIHRWAVLFWGTILFTSLLRSALAETIAISPPPEFSDAKVRAAGLRKLVGHHLTLYTDLPSRPEIDELPQVFDAAVAQWAKYLGVPLKRLSAWRMQGYLMKDREPFRTVGMLPPEREGIREGYSIDYEIWLADQPTAYYRRHLLLHEGTHGFMNTHLGSCGPGWYMEGTAEMMATHAWDGTRVTLGIMPKSRHEVPRLGRIKLVQDAFAANRAVSLADILRTNNRQPLSNEAYAWCWALTKFLDSHPRYRDRFRKLPKFVREPNFTDRFRRMYTQDWSELIQEWQLFVGTLVHNHDIKRTRIDFLPAKLLLPGESCTLSIAADRGWQSTGKRLATGQAYQITARGQYQIGDHPKPWVCEPNGVTIEYYQGRPVGRVVGTLYTREHPAARDAPGQDPTTARSPFLEPFDIGTGSTVRPEQSGTLYVKINESPGKLADNRGQIIIEMMAESP